MNKNQHKWDTIASAQQGLIEGGMPEMDAKYFALLLERVYDSGYNEAMRNIEENPKDWGAYKAEAEHYAAVKALLCDAERHLIGICDVTNFMSDEVADLLNRIRTACAARGEK